MASSELAARDRVATAAGLMIVGSACFAVMAALVKAASNEASPIQASLFRSVVSIVPVGVALRAGGGRVASPRWRLLVLRGALGFSALFFYVWAVSHGELAAVLALQQLSPIFVAFLSVVLLGERPRASHYLLAALCLAGALLVVRPTRGLVSLGAAAAILSAALSATAYVSVRTLTRTEPTARIVLWFSMVASVLSLPPALIGWQPLSTRAVCLLVGAGLCAAAGQTLMTSSYRRAQAHVASAFSYSSVPLGYVLGMVVWGERPDALGTLGIAIILAAGVAIALSVRPRAEAGATHHAAQPPDAGTGPR
jgi:drug/metabolite transporter (DMT)-like permease